MDCRCAQANVDTIVRPGHVHTHTRGAHVWEVRGLVLDHLHDLNFPRRIVFVEHWVTVRAADRTELLGVAVG